MHGLGQLEEILSAVICTGYIANDNPLSGVVISNPGNGKSECIKQFSKNNGVREISDVSQKNISQKLVILVQKGLHHLLIPDFIRLMSHKSETVNATMTVLNQLMEEGIKEDWYYSQEIEPQEQRINCGIVSALTPETFADLFVRFHAIGFFSRPLLIWYDYADTTRQQINDRIHSQINDFREIKLPKLKEKVVVTNNNLKITNAVSVMSEKLFELQKDFHITRNYHGYMKNFGLDETTNYRLSKMLWKLLKGIAIMERGSDATEIIESDLDKLESFIPFIGFRKKAQVIQI